MSLSVVSIPIGHPDDITLRAIKTLESADILICEEFKNGRKLMKQLQLDQELYCINEHNEATEVETIIQLLLKGKTAALFSDCGTPLFADPGTTLVKRCHEMGLRVTPVPGASSLMAALAIAGVPTKQFYYAGFLSRKSDVRRSEIRKFSTLDCAVVIYDTPYRLAALLKDLLTELPSARQVFLAISLTKPDEKLIYGSIKEVCLQLGDHPPKKEFVLILEPGLHRKKSKKYDKTRRKKPDY